MEDLQNLGKLLIPQIEDILDTKLEPLHKKIDHLTTSMDGVVGMIKDHSQELLVLGAQQEKTKEILVQKGIATPDELAVG